MGRHEETKSKMAQREKEGWKMRQVSEWLAYLGEKQILEQGPMQNKRLFFPSYPWPQTTKFPSGKILPSSTKTHSRLILLPLALGTLSPRAVRFLGVLDGKAKCLLPQWASKPTFFSSNANKWLLQYIQSHCPSDVHSIHRASLSLKYFSGRRDWCRIRKKGRNGLD